jgi:hypothetical protein
MSVVAASAENWNEGDDPNPLVASIEEVVAMRFGPSSATRDVGYIIEAAIQSAVPPPK